MGKKIEFDVISPDGFSIGLNTYKSEKSARVAFKEWVKRYERQGYYSSNNGRIALEDLKDECSLRIVENGEASYKSL